MCLSANLTATHIEPELKTVLGTHGFDIGDSDGGLHLMDPMKHPRSLPWMQRRDRAVTTTPPLALTLELWWLMSKERHTIHGSAMSHGQDVVARLEAWPGVQHDSWRETWPQKAKCPFAEPPLPMVIPNCGLLERRPDEPCMSPGQIASYRAILQGVMDEDSRLHHADHTCVAVPG